MVASPQAVITFVLLGARHLALSLEPEFEFRIREPSRPLVVRCVDQLALEGSQSGHRRTEMSMRLSIGRGESPSASRSPDPQRGPRRSRALLGPVVGAALLASSCQSAGVLDPRGPVASAERLLLINSTAIMLVVVVPVIAATLAFAWWYRSANPRAVRSSELAYEGRIEFVVWSIPALTVMLLGGVIWIGSQQLDPRSPLSAKAVPLRVDVVALDWKWL